MQITPAALHERSVTVIREACSAASLSYRTTCVSISRILVLVGAINVTHLDLPRIEAYRYLVEMVSGSSGKG